MDSVRSRFPHGDNKFILSVEYLLFDDDVHIYSH